MKAWTEKANGGGSNWVFLELPTKFGVLTISAIFKGKVGCLQWRHALAYLRTTVESVSPESLNEFEAWVKKQPKHETKD